jgi:hypothetical protein
MQGRADQKSADFQAAQLDRNAIATEATSQRVAIEERRKATLMQSRARAVAAAGGGTTTDVGVADILAKIDAEGEFNALSALFEGSERATGMRTQATGKRFEGKAAKRAGVMKALSTVFTGAAAVGSRMPGGGGGGLSSAALKKPGSAGSVGYGGGVGL